LAVSESLLRNRGFHIDYLGHAHHLTTLNLEAELRGKILNSSPDAPIGEELESVDFVESWLRKLPPKHALACREIYIHGRTQGEAAELVGCSKSRLSNIHSEALTLLNDPIAYRDYLEPKVKKLAQRESAMTSPANAIP
jgi:DNA-directed RNA polymerase specialized sigma24 family protein